MSKKINSEFQWLFHLAVLRRVVRDHPRDYRVYLKDIAQNVGNRLTDDFCARLLLREKIKDQDTKKYLEIFLNFYFEKDFVVRGDEIISSEPILNYQRQPGILFFSEILQVVFNYLNGNVIFSDLDDRIAFKIG